MEWNNGAGAPQPANKPAHAGSKKKLSFLSLRTAGVALVFCIAILIIAVIAMAVFGGTKDEGEFVDKSKMQAIFLNGGQVYFGKISSINDRYVRVNDIYYLRVNQTVQPDQQSSSGQSQATSNDISLVKLGCELHGPQDSMVINQSQVIFWENLKDDGQVAKAVATYKQQNPDGQKCDTASSSNSNTNSSTTNSTSNTGTSTTGNSTSTTKKP